jgi:hypothetical protein
MNVSFLRRSGKIDGERPTRYVGIPVAGRPIFEPVNIAVHS